MPEPEPELQATANLSPVSPAPVHTAPALAVPQLQDTVDTIDAMVAAALAPNGTATAGEPVVDPELLPTGDDEDDDVVDDDSFNEAYAEDNNTTDATSAPQPPTQAEDDGDDYAKTFDSPVGSENGDGNDKPASPGHEPQQTGPTENLSTVQSLTADTTKTESPQEDKPAAAAPISSDSPSQASDSAADIQQLVADLTSRPAETGVASDSNPTQSATETAASSSALPSAALPSPASLPPRPPISHNTQSYPEQHHPGQPTSTAPGTAIAQPTSHAPGAYPAAVPTVLPGASSLPPHPSPGLVAPGSAHLPQPYPAHAPAYAAERPAEDDYQRQWEQFLADERQYMTEAKWDRFPDGSRIFIGNLSSDKVSKRDVFDMFHRFGRLAQISLKSAYGFVQYHTVEEGRAAVDNLEGIEIKGRRIHLEISRAQDKAKKERGRSPDKGRGRDRDSRRGERYNQSRDEYRSGRESSPRRSDYRGRDDHYGRSRNSYDGGRNRRRSRSPDYDRHEKDPYRRRSPSPSSYGRPHGDDDIDLPRRYGADVPDVQIILEPNVNRDFANWVEMTFKGKGLQTEVMFLHPRMPKDQIIQRQAAEGVHAVVDLDLRAQSLSKVPVQAFDRSQGLNNVRFEQYVDLDPPTAAEVILRAKASGAARYGQQPYGGYSQPYGGQQQPPAPPPAYGAHQLHGYSQPPPQQQQPLANTADIAALMGQVDPATLQKLLATMQGPSYGGGPAAAAPAPNGGLDLQAILGSLGGQHPAAPQQPAPHAQYAAPYGAHPQAQPQPPPGAPTGNGDSAAQVQNIMAQLARYR